MRFMTSSQVYVPPPINIEKRNNASEVSPVNGITPTLTMGVVELSVQDLRKMTDFYVNVVGFDLVSTGASIANLWERSQVFLRLIEEKNFVFPAKWEAWLYHTAITHTNRKDVATRVARILEKTPERYQWSSDHTATEAFYFSDPENNGLELYYDRPRSEWRYKDGKPIMWSTYLDTMKYIKKYKNIPISSGEARMGHVHLKIGDISIAKNFYENILLFDEINNTSTALFISRDWYHHHLGMNTWESLGAKKKTQKTYGLRSFELIYHDEKIYSQIIENLEKNNIPTIKENNAIITEDPWGNAIIINKE